MQELNGQSLRSLMQILAEEEVSSPRKPALIEYRGSVVFTDGGLLLEWPNKLVDDDSSLFRKLIEAGKKQPEMVRLQEAESWLGFLSGGTKVKFHPVQEAEPDDDDYQGCMAYVCRTRRCYYRIGYITAVEEMLGTDKLTYKCYVPPRNQDLVILCVFYDGDPVGAVANEANRADDATQDAR